MLAGALGSSKARCALVFGFGFFVSPDAYDVGGASRYEENPEADA